MKILVFLLFFVSFNSQAKVFFQPRLDHESAQELVWNFSTPVKDWGKTDKDQVELDCPNTKADFDLNWSNASTLKLVFKNNLPAGLTCKSSLKIGEPANHTFKIPLIKVLDVLPWNFDALEEDSAFIVRLEAPLDSENFVRSIYMDVEGLSEKVEFDLVSGDERKRVLKAAYQEDRTSVIVLKPRMNFPVEKNIVFVIKEGQSFKFEKQGRVREPFRIKMTCERTNPDAPCSPLSSISLNFTSDVSVEELKGIKLVLGRKEFTLGLSGDSSRSYVSFPTKLEAEAEYKIIVPAGIKDLNGRPLNNADKFPLTFKTASFPPLAKFPGAFGILESNADPILPVSVRNVEKQIVFKKNTAIIDPKNPVLIMQWKDAIDKRQSMGWDKDLRGISIFQGSKVKLQTETLKYTASKNDIEILGLPLNKKGLHLVELESPMLGQTLLGEKKNFFISTAVLVTNMVAHLKLGKSSTMVWVTSLDKGEVVPEAEVSVYNCLGKVLGKGKTDDKGIIHFPSLGNDHLKCQSKLENFNGKMMVVAAKGDDTTFTLSNWDEGIEPWRFSIYGYGDLEQNRAHTVFDRPIYKQGEKVHMLHLLRAQGEKGLIFSKEKLTHLMINHWGTGKEWKFPLKWNNLSTSTTEFVLPADAPQGTYNLSIVKFNNKNQIETKISAGLFLVKDFRVPLMRSSLSIKDNRQDFIQGEDINLLGHLEFLAGGVSSDTQVTLRGEINPSYGKVFKSYPKHIFSFGEPTEKETDSGTILDKKTTTTDKKGDFNFVVKSLPKSKRLQNLNLEIEYLDPSGAYQTNSTALTIFPYSTLIGIKSPETIKVGKVVNFQVVALNQKEKALKDVVFEASLIEVITTSTRKKILGGFYTYDNSQSYKNHGKVCSGKTDAKGEGLCSFNLKEGGQYYFVVDTNGSKSNIAFYAYGSDNEWSPQEYHDRMDMLADKKEYVPGEKAVFELKLPFEKATVLLTKERAGITKSYLIKYERKNPFVSLPVENEDFPNTYVSALAVRGRLAEGQATGLVDLSRPAYRLGLVEIKVNRVDQNLLLTLTPDKKTFKVRGEVKLKIKVITADKTPLRDTKVAISVFDEGLLLINGQNSFDVRASLIKPFIHQVDTATAQGHVIGKRHFGLKAKPHGGGGGKDLRPRELFDTLIYWNPSVALDNNGEATVSFKLNDSLTSFKIYGLAYAEDRFGKENISINSTQDVLSFVGTSPTIRTGDQFSASYTLKNITSKEKSLTLKFLIDGKMVEEKKIKIAASESHSYQYLMKPFTKVGEARYSLSLFEGAEKIDELKTTQKILPLYTPRVSFSDLKEVSGKQSIPGLRNAERFAGTQILLSSSLVPGPEGMRQYMRDYAYNCLEQQFAKIVVLEDAKLFQQFERNFTSYTDERGFLKFYPYPSGYGSIELTAHILELAYWDERVLARKVQLEMALARLVSGEIPLQDWEKANLAQLKMRAMVALKLTKSPQFNPNWLKDISSPQGSDTLSELMNKWIVFQGDVKAQEAHDLIRQKLKIDGSTVTLLSGRDEGSSLFLYSEAALFGRFLLLQKTIPVSADFNSFFDQNEGKFVRGYLGLRREGYFPETISNVLAYIIQKKWKSLPVLGTTSILDRKSVWQNQMAPMLSLTREEGLKDQVLEHKGTGKPWADIRYFVFPDPAKTTFNGIEVSQVLSKLEESGDFKAQDRLKMEVTITNKAEVVMPAIRIPLPSGSTILNSSSNEVSIIFEERTEHEWRGYFAYLPKGTHKLEITFRLNQAGDFEIPGTRIEALYSPEIFGELPYWNMKVK